MTFDLQEPRFEENATSEQVEALLERLTERSQPEDDRARPVEVTPDLIQRLARQLSLACGEDPDERPIPRRHPCWQYHYTRAKTLLSITAAEQEALAAVLQR